MTKPKTKKRSALVRERPKAIVVGVTDLRELYRSPSGPLPPGEVTVRLHHEGTTLSPTVVNQKSGPRVAARFTDVVPKTSYQATAFRRIGTDVVATALPKWIELPGGKDEVAVNLDLHHVPVLHLVAASFDGDHGVITEPPEPVTYYRYGEHYKEVESSWGDGSGASAKPEYRETSARHNPPGKSSTEWDAASYDLGASVTLKLEFRVSVPDKRPHTLERVRIHGGDLALTFETEANQALVDGASFPLDLKAKRPLPEHVDVLKAQLVMTASGDGHPMRVERASHQVEVFVTLGKPRGKAKMHDKYAPGPVYPETGPAQKITAPRLRWAVKGARGATGHEQAVRMLFAFLREEEISYFPHYQYPEADVSRNKTGFTKPRRPDLHEFLWFGMAETEICHCLDLAAGFRLLARMVGAKGKMKVRQCYPWPPWDEEGNRRDLDQDGEPWQASLKKYPMPFGRKLVFIDGDGAVNFFEAVLRYVPPGSGRAMQLPVGLEILEAHGPDVKPGPMDDRNASLFFQASKHDKWKGKYALAVKLPDDLGYRKPPFDFVTHKSQYRFRFHYDADTFEAGDDEKP